jgi:uncharacterized coiled-coil protein SlyX
MATDPAALAELLLDLEVRVAYQDRTIAALDEVVRVLFTRLEKVENELVEVRASGGAAPMIGPANDPPPHY